MDARLQIMNETRRIVGSVIYLWRSFHTINGANRRKDHPPGKYRVIEWAGGDRVILSSAARRSEHRFNVSTQELRDLITSSSPESVMNDFNKFPDGWREITEAQFSRSSFFTQVPERSETRQMHPEPKTADKARLTLDGRTQVMAATLWHYPDRTGVGIVSEYAIGRVRFFLFGCDHDLHAIDDERLRCERCQLVVGRPDSSG